MDEIFLNYENMKALDESQRALDTDDLVSGRRGVLSDVLNARSCVQATKYFQERFRAQRRSVEAAFRCAHCLTVI
jgi:hypothetical protein